MTKKIKVVTEKLQMEAELNDTETAQLVWTQLPIKGRVRTWGDEIYFEIPVAAAPENATAVVEEGDLAYWPDGRCFCLFFGNTPASTATEIRPASPVNLLGRLTGNPKLWKAVDAGSYILLERIEE
ncbi:MAG TPA: cyclophilin-like fold protein [Candidatus Limnocylindrales bacterium]|nr:cyclophilin-like fold protein [Candidatus Limnocylindrales bacterium]